MLFLLVLAGSTRAQQDTTGGDQSWMSMPVVADTPRTDTLPLLSQAQLDSIRVADSLKKYGGVDEKEFIKTEIKNLCGKNMNGRGYVANGSDSAARYILKRFKEFNLKPVNDKGSFEQGFAFPVNTFPARMDVFINGDSLWPGRAYVVDPASSSFAMDSSAVTIKVKKVKLGKVSDTAAWARKLAEFDSSHAYLLEGLGDVAESLQMRPSKVVAMLPKGLFIIPKEGRLKWATRREQIAATVIYAQDDSLPKKVKNISVRIDAVYNTHQHSENIVACVPGEIKDSFIVFTAHYDHIGCMGKKTVFQGASDNASGTAMLIYLANYYSRHKPKYTMVFIAFGAEEASLMGSEFFVWNPMIPLSNIKFLTNIDIMGDAKFGITVENAGINAGQFARLQDINNKEKYLKTLYPRPLAVNSDHYYFARKNVPCFYIHSNGGQGYNHDVFDVKTALSLNSVREVSRLLIDFVAEWKDMPMAEKAGPPAVPGEQAAPTEAPPAVEQVPNEGPSDVPQEPTTPPKEDAPTEPPAPSENPEKTPEK